MKTSYKLALVLALLAAASLAPMAAKAAPELPIIVVDLAHGQNHNGVCAMMSVVPDAYWVVVVKDQAAAEQLPNCVKLRAYDVIVGDLSGLPDLRPKMVIIGQPVDPLSDEEKQAVLSWFTSPGDKALWCAGDSDYPAQGGNLELAMTNCNDLLDFLASNGIDIKVRLDYVSIEDPVSNAGRSYRVVALVEPSTTKFGADLLALGAKKVLMHGPGAVAWVDDAGNWHKVGEAGTPENIFAILVTTDQGTVVEHQPRSPGEPGNLGFAHTAGETGKFVLMAAQVLETGDGRKVVIVSGESPYYGYQSLVTAEYYGVKLDGPRFFRNLVLWATNAMGELEAFRAVASKAEEAAREIEGKLPQISSAVDQLRSTVGSLESRLGSVEGKVSNLEGTVGELQSTIQDMVKAVNTAYTLGVAGLVLGVIAIIAAGLALRRK
ncbi:MAG: hypothetical protein ABWW70_01140 [Thermoproteota archaeon]